MVIAKLIQKLVERELAIIMRGRVAGSMHTGRRMKTVSTVSGRIVLLHLFFTHSLDRSRTKALCQSITVGH